MTRCPAHVRATLDEAASVASGQGVDVRAVVVLIVAPGTITVIGERADVAMLPGDLRRALEAATAGRKLALLCPKCGGREAGR